MVTFPNAPGSLLAPEVAIMIVTWAIITLSQKGTFVFQLLSSLLLGAASPDGMTNFISIESPGWIVIGIVLGSKRTVTAPEDET